MDDDNPSNAALKAHREREIFKLFVECARLDIPVPSIESRQSPEPDILCLLDGAPRAFELGELSDQGFREGTSLAVESQRMLDGARWSLPPEIVQSLELEYRPRVVVAFHESANLRVRKAAPVELLKWLAQERPPAGKLFGADLPKSIRRAVQRVEIQPGVGFFVHLAYSTAVAAPDLRVMDKKLQANYVTQHPMELLLHGEYNLMPRDAWMDRYGQQIRDKIDGSQFRRVWVFNPAERAGQQYELWLVHENPSWRSGN